MIEFGPMLRQQRKELGLNQEAMAARMHCDASTISLYERGVRQIQPEYYAQLCVAYELDYARFIVTVFELPAETLAPNADNSADATHLSVVPTEKVA